MIMTVKDLRKAMRGLDPNTPVYTRAHDNEDWETQGPVTSVELFDQSDPDIQERMSEESCRGLRGKLHVQANRIDGAYLLLST